MKTTKITYLDYQFQPYQFLASSEIRKPFLADIIATISIDAGDIDVFINSVRAKGGMELVGFLKSEAEWELSPILRSFYLAEARHGLEGEASA